MTEIDKVYGSFLSKVNDYNLSLLNRSEAEIYEILSSYYNSAIAFFPQCRKDLKITDDGFVNDELTNLEIEIIAELMILQYLYPIIHRSEVLEQVLSDKDFKVNSQANHMNQLYNLYNKTRQEVSTHKVHYSWGGIYE